jgi:hypothetical protein
VCAHRRANFFRNNLQLFGMTARRVCYCFVIWLLPVLTAEAQTNCAKQYPAQGVFICYPNPSENGADAIVPNVFHLSAQANAGDGREITRYIVRIDNRVIVDIRLTIPIQRLPIETNLKSPFDSGTHTLHLEIHGVGSAEVAGLEFYPSKNTTFCDPFSRSDPRSCAISKIRGPLRWSLTESNQQKSTLESVPKPTDPIDSYLGAFIELYGQNLKSMEADASDAIAVDAQGNTYVATHVLADVELRKYSPDGSIIYDSLVRSCGDGFLSVTGLAIDSAGRAWIAGNTTACLPPTPNAIPVHVSEVSRTRGFVILVETVKPTSVAPLYVTYLADVDNRITAIRVDARGNTYVTGTTASPEFPHESLLNVGESPAHLPDKRLSFVSALNPLGSGFLWSTLVENAVLTALALDEAGNVYVTGRMASPPSPSGTRDPEHSAQKSCGTQGKLPIDCDDVLIAELSDRGRRLSYVARLGGSADEEGRAISTTARGAWIFVAGDTGSRDFPTSAQAGHSRPEGLESFAVALQPCKSGAQYSGLLTEVRMSAAVPIALTPALDAVTAAFGGAVDAVKLVRPGVKPVASVQIAPACPSTPP